MELAGGLAGIGCVVSPGWDMVGAAGYIRGAVDQVGIGTPHAACSAVD